MKQKRQAGFAEILASVRNDGRRRLISKIPQWSEWADIIKIPAAINLEQCTCGAAASYKAELARKLTETAEGVKIADLTGGLGVDSRAFSKMAAEVLHNERNKELSQTVAANFAAMGTDNVRFSNFDIGPDDNAGWEKFVRDFGPDMIYVDPARRDAAGRKVFLPQDCAPDIVSLMPRLLEISGTVMVKFSPLMDIKALISAFGNRLNQIHIVSSGGEVKELLCVFSSGNATEQDIKRENCKPMMFITGNNCKAGQNISVDTDAEAASSAVFPTDIPTASFLFEPGAGLMKAGLFKYLSARYGLVKLAPSTHLYTADAENAELVPYGKFFRILDTLPLDKPSMKMLSEKYPHADVSARNIPLSSDSLRQRMGLRAGANTEGIHIFAATVSTVTKKERMFFVTSSL